MAEMTVYEQLVLELINRARLDPAAEAARLGIGLNDGISGTAISTAAKQVLAANPFLVDAARAHSDWMLDNDVFSHTGSGGSSPTTRMQAAGYTLSGSWTTGENIAWAGTTGSLDLATYTQNLHDNLFRSAGHRANMMNDNFREVGLGELTGEFSGYNAAMLTENFARSGTKYFITGVAITDTDGDEFYDIGEARGGIAVSVSGQGSDTTETAGGYAVAVNSGTHTVTFSGGGLPASVSVTVAAGSANAKIDLAGNSTILASATTTLATGALNLTLLGVAALDGTGNGDANTLKGNKGANTLMGAGGSDTLIGLAGNDTLDGGDGSDTASYRGRKADYVVTANADGSFTVRDANTGDGLDEGSDTLRAVETLRFLASGETTTLAPTPPADDPPAGDPPADDPPADDPPAPSGPTAAADVVLGTTLADIIDALGGADRVSGGEGGDTLFGSIGDDVLYGEAGNDWLYGGHDNDVVSGGLGNDRLFGDHGNDTLRADAGLDWLTGGLGRDTLYGGADRDRFDFNALNESRGSTRDVIRDFQRRVDDIDVSTLDANSKVAGNQRFKFIGDDAFSKTAGELHAVRVGSTIRVEGDINGDGRADFAIDVTGTGALLAGDFIL